MNVLVLFLLLLKATLISFAGLASLPIVHNDLVLQRHVLTDHQLNTAVAVARMGPGPLGLYLVCVGYMIAGIPGAVAGCVAMLAPAFLVIPILRWLGDRSEAEGVQRTIRAVILAAAGLLISATIPMARDALNSGAAWIIALISFCLLGFTRTDTLWVILGSAVAGVAAYLLAVAPVP